MPQLNTLLHLLIIFLIVSACGCTSINAPAEPAESSEQAAKIIQLENKIDMLQDEIDYLKQRKSILENALRNSNNENQTLLEKIDALEKRIHYLTSVKIEQQTKAYQAEIEQLNKKEHELNKQIKRLNSSLQDIHSNVVAGSVAGKTPEMMANDIKLSVEKLKSQLDKTTEQRKKLQNQVAKQRSEIEVLKNESVSTQSDSQDIRALSALSLDKSESKKPEIVEVFYGTNRQRLVTTWSDILKPFVYPFILLLAFFIVPWVIRLTLKDHLQHPSILLSNTVIGAAFLFLAFTGIQSSALKWQAKNSLVVQYGPDRMQHNTELPFELGICHVSIPPTHQPGVVELPSLMYLELTVDPDKHFMMSDIQPHAKEAFFNKLSEKVKHSPDKDMFVFVHGFHNTFENAAFRTAQIAYDLNFTGAPVFFSWPSQGKVVDYPTDESNAGAAVKDLRIFLEALVEHSKADKIHLIAHSMGNRVLTRAVKEISLSANGEAIFNEVVLAAPDMDAKTFKNIVPDMAKRVERVTLYASSRDKALVVSNVLHGEYQRAGESKPYPVVINPIESIDVSSVTDGHSYIADDGQILDDLNAILKDSRLLTKEIAESIVVNNDEVFWVLRQPVN